MTYAMIGLLAVLVCLTIFLSLTVSRLKERIDVIANSVMPWSDDNLVLYKERREMIRNLDNRKRQYILDTLGQVVECVEKKIDNHFADCKWEYDRKLQLSYRVAKEPFVTFDQFGRVMPVMYLAVWVKGNKYGCALLTKLRSAEFMYIAEDRQQIIEDYDKNGCVLFNVVKETLR